MFKKKMKLLGIVDSIWWLANLNELEWSMNWKQISVLQWHNNEYSKPKIFYWGWYSQYFLLKKS